MWLGLAVVLVLAWMLWPMLTMAKAAPDRQRVALMRPKMLDAYELEHFKCGGRATYRILYTVDGQDVAETSVIEMLPPATWMRARVAELRAQSFSPTVIRCTRRGGQWVKKVVDA